jgi:hypothetical protein
VGRIGYSTPVNTREEAGRAALEVALIDYAVRVGGEPAKDRREDIAVHASSLRELATNLSSQRRAFADMGAWLIEKDIITTLPENDRAARASAREAAGLKGNIAATSLADFQSPDSPDADRPEMLLDLEIIAIYW